MEAKEQRGQSVIKWLAILWAFTFVVTISNKQALSEIFLVSTDKFYTVAVVSGLSVGVILGIAKWWLNGQKLWRD